MTTTLTAGDVQKARYALDAIREYIPRADRARALDHEVVIRRLLSQVDKMIVGEIGAAADGGAAATDDSTVRTSSPDDPAMRALRGIACAVLDVLPDADRLDVLADYCPDCGALEEDGTEHVCPVADADEKDGGD